MTENMFIASLNVFAEDMNQPENLSSSQELQLSQLMSSRKQSEKMILTASARESV